MAAPGRNDPCPCGSGRKFKRCCANLAAEPIVTAADRDQAFELLTKFSETRRFEEDLELAAILFWGEDLADDFPELDDDELWLPTLFADWCLFDYITTTGRTIAEHALDERRDKLWPGARRFVERCIASPFRLTQVEQVDRGRGFILNDLLERGRTYTVRDQLGSEYTVRHDVLVARLVREANDWIIEGTPAPLQVLDKEPLLREIKRVRKRFEREAPERSDAMERMIISRTILSFVVARVLFAEPPELHTADGDALEPMSIFFDIIDPALVRDVLGGAAAFSRCRATTPHGGEQYEWIEETEHAGISSRRILAHLTLTENRLRLDTLSARDAERAESDLAALLGDNITPIEMEDDLLDEAVSADMDGDAGSLPAEVAAEVERQFYEEHYRNWIDEPLLALGGRTPREASTMKRLRRRLRTLVEAIENQAAHLALDNRGFDVDWLRKELGFREEQPAPQRTAVNRA